MYERILGGTWRNNSVNNGNRIQCCSFHIIMGHALLWVISIWIACKTGCLIIVIWWPIIMCSVYNKFSLHLLYSTFRRFIILGMNFRLYVVTILKRILRKESQQQIEEEFWGYFNWKSYKGSSIPVKHLSSR